MRILAISVDPPEVNQRIYVRRGYTYTFLSDPDAQVIRRYDLLHKGMGLNGTDIARPAEFLLDSSGTVRWVNLTENWRVRARPADVLRVVDGLHLASEAPVGSPTNSR